MIIDAHLDLAFNAVGNGADLRLEIGALRASPFGRMLAEKRETPTVSLPALRDGGVALVFGTVFVPSRGSVFNVTGPSYGTASEAYELGQKQLDYYHGLAAAGEIMLVRDRDELVRATAPDRAPSHPRPGVLIAMEGADCIGEVRDLPKWVARGVRLIGPAWGRTRFGGGTGAPGPLTDLGRELLDEMHRLGVALDLSHQSDEGFWEAIERFRGPVCASHSNCRAIVPGDRQISDDMIRAIVARGGVVGVVLYNRYLQAGYELAQGKVVPMSSVVRHIEHICNIAGSTNHVGIGSDLDGGLGVEWTPIGLDSAADLGAIARALQDARWSAADIANVMSANWLRWLRAHLR